MAGVGSAWPTSSLIAPRLSPMGLRHLLPRQERGVQPGWHRTTCWYQRIPLLDLDPDVVTGEANISILAVVTGGACGGPKALGFTAGTAVRDYFV